MTTKREKVIIEDGFTALRQKNPALALTLNFAQPSLRQPLADALLLWFEIIHAQAASEALLAAARLTWWHDALVERKAEAVPLAVRLLASDGLDIKIKALADIREVILTGDPPDQVHHAYAPVFKAISGEGDEGEYSLILHSLREALAGKASERHTLSHSSKSFRLMAWLAEEPSRLSYPDEKPLLAISMIIASYCC